MRIIIMFIVILLSVLSIQTLAQDEKSYTKDFSIAEKTFPIYESTDIEWTHSGGLLKAKRNGNEFFATNIVRLVLLHDANI